MTLLSVIVICSYFQPDGNWDGHVKSSSNRESMRVKDFKNGKYVLSQRNFILLTTTVCLGCCDVLVLCSPRWRWTLCLSTFQGDSFKSFSLLLYLCCVCRGFTGDFVFLVLVCILSWIINFLIVPAICNRVQRKWNVCCSFLYLPCLSSLLDWKRYVQLRPT